MKKSKYKYNKSWALHALWSLNVICHFAYYFWNTFINDIGFVWIIEKARFHLHFLSRHNMQKIFFLLCVPCQKLWYLKKIYKSKSWKEKVRILFTMKSLASRKDFFLFYKWIFQTRDTLEDKQYKIDDIKNQFTEK